MWLLCLRAKRLFFLWRVYTLEPNFDLTVLNQNCDGVAIRKLDNFAREPVNRFWRLSSSTDAEHSKGCEGQSHLSDSCGKTSNGSGLFDAGVKKTSNGSGLFDAGVNNVGWFCTLKSINKNHPLVSLMLKLTQCFYIKNAYPFDALQFVRDNADEVAPHGFQASHFGDDL